ncbi:hypothetical protein EJB05_04042 [Eragrostis curvula]|uniref:Uncharacterized protein n=1 Tax=Eragrostis curvula TaxID=38414 RepID=A0A5J9W9L3_9POAL|nr:hypothetical protein EJB05_04042 [Eragrostis curvula]
MRRLFVTVGRRRRPRQPCVSATGGDGVKRCKGHLIDTIPESINDEIVWEILIRLPVASLAKFKTVSKAWHSLISDPVFVRAHFQCSKQKQRRNPASFLISPQVLLDPGPPETFSTNVRFYQWHMEEDTKSKAAEAELVYGRLVQPGEFGLVCFMAHCDGLVLLPTNTKAYVFNPMTQDSIALPASKRNKMYYHRCLPIGLGFDASTGKYKVARFFYRSDAVAISKMGMEVFTINGEEGSWRETVVDPPYPILHSQTATHVNGCLYYFIDKKNQQRPPQGLLRFSLKDETFGVTPLLTNTYPQVEDEDIFVNELNGDLCATFFCKVVRRVLIFVTTDVIHPSWYCCYAINVQEQCYPMASLGSRVILLRGGNGLFRYNLEADRVEKDGEFDMNDMRFLGPCEDTLGRAWDDVDYFDPFPCVAALSALTSGARLPVFPSLHVDKCKVATPSKTNSPGTKGRFLSILIGPFISTVDLPKVASITVNLSIELPREVQQ